MRNAAFQPFVTTVGADGTMVMPLSDASSSGIPILIVGPGYSRNAVRYFVTMPDKEEAVRHLPVPIGYNRESVTFEPRALIVSGPLPFHCTVMFIRIRAGSDKGKISKKAAHLWSPLDNTALWPAIPLNMPPLSPGETLDFQGTSYWYNDSNYKNRKAKSVLTFPLPPEPPPQVLTKMPASLQLLVKLHWLPNDTRKRQFSFVNGSPIGHESDTRQADTGAPPVYKDPKKRL